MSFSKKFLFIVLASFFLSIFCNSVLAEKTLSEAITNGKVSGEVKIWYQTYDNSHPVIYDGGVKAIDNNKRHLFEKENAIFDAGVRLGYLTDTFYGFGAGVTFYAADDLGAYDNFANGSMNRWDNGVPEHHQTQTWLGEVYLTYKISHTMAKFGRQNIKSPLINSDGWALFPNNFEAYLIESSEIPDTTIRCGYIKKERWLKSEDFDDISDNGIIMLGLINQSIPNTVLSAYCYSVDQEDDVTDTADNWKEANDSRWYYFEAKTKLAVLGFAAQYLYIDPSTHNTDETNAFGFKISSDFGMVNLSAAFCSVDPSDINATKISDHQIKTPLYTATITGDGDIAGAVDTDSFKLSVGFKPIDSLKLIANYGYYDHGRDAPRTLADEVSRSAELVAKYTGIEKVTLFAGYFHTDHNGQGVYRGSRLHEGLDTLRFWAKYAF